MNKVRAILLYLIGFMVVWLSAAAFVELVLNVESAAWLMFSGYVAGTAGVKFGDWLSGGDQA